MNAVGGSHIKAIKAFVKAAGDGDLATVVEMLEEGRVEVNDATWSGDTALLAVARNGPENRVALCRLLTQKGAQVNCKSFGGVEPLSLAAQSGFVDLCRELVGAGADVEATDDDVGRTPLVFAVQHEHLEVVKLLLKAGARATAKGPHGQTALMHASQVEEPAGTDICKLLVEHGACVRDKNRWDETVLHCAAEGRAAICRWLFDNGAEEDLFSVAITGCRPLDLARQANKPETYLLLLERMMALCGDAEADNELKWSPTAHREPSWETKEKRLVAFREDSWRRRAHLVAFYKANNVYTGGCLRKEEGEGDEDDYDDDYDDEDEDEDEGDKNDDRTEADTETGNGDAGEDEKKI